MPLTELAPVGTPNFTCWDPHTSGTPGHPAFAAISSLVGSLLVTLTVRPPAGAGDGDRTGFPVASVTTSIPPGPTGWQVEDCGLQLVSVNNVRVIEVCRF